MSQIYSACFLDPRCLYCYASVARLSIFVHSKWAVLGSVIKVVVMGVCFFNFNLTMQVDAHVETKETKEAKETTAAKVLDLEGLHADAAAPAPASCD